MMFHPIHLAKYCISTILTLGPSRLLTVILYRYVQVTDGIPSSSRHYFMHKWEYVSVM